MQWEYMVTSGFKKAVSETGLCVIPVGSLERHGDHLPYGCDMLIARELSIRASEIEPVEPLNRLKHLQDNGVHNALWWYADFPENINGNPSLASEKKGKAILDIYTKAFTRAIRAVKEDTATDYLRTEFLERVSNKEK